jgi:hypothetical protein
MRVIIKIKSFSVFLFIQIFFRTEVNQACNSGCQCDFVKYSPVCSEDGQTTYISACHAGCTDYHIQDGKKVIIFVKNINF